MSLFSWFTKSMKTYSPKNSKASLEQELITFNNNTMWPIAKVRKNIAVQQQEYVSTVANLKGETQVSTLKEHTN